MKFIFGIFCLVALIGCGGSSNSEPSNPQIEATLILIDTFSQESQNFSQGEDIEFLLTLTNSSTASVTLDFNSGQQYDFYINSPDGVNVWRWSDEGVFIQALTTLTIGAGESLEVRQVWNQVLPDGETISIGDYSAFGLLLGQSPSEAFNFSIQ